MAESRKKIPDDPRETAQEVQIVFREDPRLGNSLSSFKQLLKRQSQGKDAR